MTSSEEISQHIDQENEVTTPESISSHYDRLRVLLESMETDALKNQGGNKAAGTRLRKSLRLLKNYSSEFVKFSLSADR